jgi:hypothetical protein
MFIIDIYKQLFDNLKAIGEVFSYTWFVVLPVAFYYVFKLIWKDYIQCKWVRGINYDLLEIVPPKNIEKSPQPMESFFSGLSGVISTPNQVEEWVKGVVTYKFSLELVSDEGTVHFYIRTPKQFRNLVEAHLYAQYPDVIINEIEDYVAKVPAIIPNSEWELWGTDFELAKPDPYPIKTYRSFQEDVTGKMIDPLAGLVEVMGKLSMGQKIWFQYVIIPLKETWNFDERQIVDIVTGRAKKPVSFLSSLLSDLLDVFGNIGKALSEPVEFPTKESKEESPLEFRLTPVEKDVLKALENNLGKNVFMVKMRLVVLGKRENFDKTAVSAFIGGLKQFNDMNMNNFRPNDQSKTYASHLFVGSRLRFRQRKIFKRYRDRDPTGKTFVLSTEELATVFHMPDMSVVAPSVTFVEAKRGGAPSNLPV